MKVLITVKTYPAMVDKLPYKFSFIFEDDSGKKSTMMIEDWETGMLYWNSYHRYKATKKKHVKTLKKNTMIILQKPKIIISF